MITQVRYVGGRETLHFPFTSGADGSSSESAQVELEGDFVVMHVCSSFDSLRTSMFPTDVVVLTSEQDPADLVEQQEQQPTPPWSQHAAAHASRDWLYRSGLELDRYGTIIVNRSLQAAINVYVAGDLASCPYPIPNTHDTKDLVGLEEVPMNGNTTTDIKKKWNHHRTVYQRGHDVGILNAKHTGICAGKNMQRCHVDGEGGRGGSCEMPSYRAIAPYSGLDFRFIGDCSNHHSSYSFWLKSSAASPSVSKSISSTNHGAVKQKNNSGKPMSVKKCNATKGLYGEAGVVFYVDGSNTIKGILLCGKSTSHQNMTSDIDISDQYNDLKGKKKNLIEESLLCLSPFSLIGKQIMPDAARQQGRDSKILYLQEQAEMLTSSQFNISQRSVRKQPTVRKKRTGNNTLPITSTTASHDRSRKNCMGSYTQDTETEDFTDLPSLDSSSSCLPSTPPQLRFIFTQARPRGVLNAGMTLATEHPWRYAVQSSIATENIFYVKK